jgi:mono/diheme cytochrome c family protein
MPSFEIAKEERGQLAAFLVAMDKTGVGEARVVTAGSFSDRVDRLLAGGSKTHSAGWQLVQERACLACHAPFDKGPTGAPAFTSVGGFEASRIDSALQVGKAPLMPPPTPALSEDERGDLLAFLQWLNTQSDALRPVKDGAEWTIASLPWWEYP